MKPLVNIIIANWNGKDLLSDCMEGLKRQVFTSFRITIVDNGSTDGSIDFIEKNYPDVEIIALNKNTGFSVANNIAIKRSDTKYIALLNNDTEASPVWLKHLVDTMEAHPEAGFAASKMLYHRSPETIDRVGDIYTTAGTALLRGRGKLWNHYNSQEFVFGACAGAAIYRKDMFDDIGLFDEDFFLLYEDVDLSFRAQLRGYKCLYVPDAIVYHKVGSSIGHDSSISIYHTHRNILWTYIKCMPRGLILKTIFQHLFYCLGSLLYFSFIGHSLTYMKAKYHALLKLRHILKKRFNIQKNKKVTNKYIWELFTHEKFLHRIFRRFDIIPEKYATHVLIDFTQIPLEKVGVGVYATNLINEIVKLPSRIKCFVLIIKDENYFDSLADDKVECIRVSKYFRYPFLRLLLEQTYIPYLTYKMKINIVHSLHYTFPISPLKAKKVVTIHDMSFILYPNLHKKLKTLYFNKFIKMLPEKADKIIAISQSTHDDFISLTRANRNKLAVVHLGRPDWQHTTSADVTFADLKKRLQLKYDYLLYIGMIEPRKNITNIIYAFNKLLQSQRKFQLVIAGPKGWHYKPIFNLIKNYKLNGKVLIPGYITNNEKAILLKHAKIFVYPSLYEGFGLPVLEAMSLGIPTITSNISSMPEITGDAALLINPESINELHAGMEKLIEDKQLYSDLKEKSVRQAHRFSWENTAKETLSIYEHVLNDALPLKKDLA